MHRKFDHIILLALITSASMMFALTTPVWASEQSTATIEVRVSQGDDDAEESTGNGQVNLTSSDLELVRTSVDQIIGVRFQNVMIPKGSTITNAYILFTTDETDDGRDMDPDSYYRDHWVEIEPERLDAYEAMFQWRPELEPLLAPAAITSLFAAAPW